MLKVHDLLSACVCIMLAMQCDNAQVRSVGGTCLLWSISITRTTLFNKSISCVTYLIIKSSSLSTISLQSPKASSLRLYNMLIRTGMKWALHQAAAFGMPALSWVSSQEPSEQAVLLHCTDGSLHWHCWPCRCPTSRTYWPTSRSGSDSTSSPWGWALLQACQW